MTEAPRKLVIFADGTANAYGGSSTNVWRLYQALDTTTQRGRYFRGVGTSSNRVWRALDGALGLGVPATVRKAYRFLCWNYQPGDEIHLVGFSRGAFTVRTLAGMIARQGLMPREIAGRLVTNEEMRRNTRGAWRAYRARTAPLDGLRALSLASLGRPLIAACTKLYRGWMGYMPHSEVEEIRDDRWKQVTPQGSSPLTQDSTRIAHLPDLRPGEVKIAFMGLYDTVEAYGLPVEELRWAFDQVLWPIQFRDHKVAACVQVVRHALSLDDCRLTFHPVHAEANPANPGQDIKEVWFAGCHADIGGGYPDDALSAQALVWMARESGLTFTPSDMAKWKDRRTPAALVHDSRSGAASFYRFAPRPIVAETLPVLHNSVREKIREGNDGYGPVSLHAPFAWEPVGNPPEAPRLDPASPWVPSLTTKARALAQLQLIVDRFQMAVLILLLLLPETGRLLSRLLPPALDPALPWAEAILSNTPFYLKPHVGAALLHPVVTLALVTALFLMNRAAGALGSAVQDEARAMWTPGVSLAAGKARQAALRLGGWLLDRKGMRQGMRALAQVAMPLLFFAGCLLAFRILARVFGLA